VQQILRGEIFYLEEWAKRTILERKKLKTVWGYGRERKKNTRRKYLLYKFRGEFFKKNSKEGKSARPLKQELGGDRYFYKG